MRRMPRKLFSLFALFVMVVSGVLVTPGRVSAAAIIVVTTTEDENNYGSGCSLREAIISANTGTGYGGCEAGSSGPDTIYLNSNSNYRLDRGGELLITGPLTISGGGPRSTHIIGVGNRVFHIAAGQAAAVILSGMEISHGGLSTGDGGAGIYNESGTLTLSNVLMNGNVGGAGQAGGALFNDTGATVIVSTSTFYGNQSGTGAAIHNLGTMTIKSSLILGNSTSTNGSGGGIYNDYQSTVTIINSTISANKASVGDGISNNGTMIIINSTIADNGSPQSGQGIYLYDRTKTTIINTIISGNPTNCLKAPGGTIEFFDTKNLINPMVPTCPWQNSAGGDPKLSTLDTSNWAYTNAYKIADGSPAIDAADTANCPTTDQRLYGRPGANATCDIGAYEHDGSQSGIFLPLVDR